MSCTSGEPGAGVLSAPTAGGGPDREVVRQLLGGEFLIADSTLKRVFHTRLLHETSPALRACGVEVVSDRVHLEPNPDTGARCGTIAYLEPYQAPDPPDPPRTAEYRPERPRSVPWR
jgi:hypothetical protein